MPRYSPKDYRQHSTLQERMLPRLHPWIIPVLLATLMGIAPACLFKKKKAAAPPVVPAGPIRIAFLPTNPGLDDSQLRWMSLAVPVLMTKQATISPDLDPVPLWQLLPVAVENAGASRMINPELASYLASRTGARWAAMGEITPSKDGFTLLIDFIPVRTAAYAFRYQKAASLSSLESNLRQAIDAFLHYQLPNPVIGKESKSATDAGLLRQIAETLDTDYGWYVPPEPGKGDAVAASLSRSDSKLARLIFSPTLYPVVGAPPPAPSATSPVPMVPPPPESQKPPDTSKVAPAPSPPAGQPAPSSAPPQAVTAEPATELQVEVPPPKHFTLRVQRPLPSESGAAGEKLNSENSRGSPASARAGPSPAPASPLREARDSASTTPLKNPLPPPESPGTQTSRTPAFRIQVTSVRIRASAEAEAQRLAKMGLAIAIEEVNLGQKGTFYRVYLTGFKSRAEAIEAAKKLRAEDLIRDFLPVP